MQEGLTLMCCSVSVCTRQYLWRGGGGGGGGELHSSVHQVWRGGGGSGGGDREQSMCSGGCVVADLMQNCLSHVQDLSEVPRPTVPLTMPPSPPSSRGCPSCGGGRGGSPCWPPVQSCSGAGGVEGGEGEGVHG